MTCDHANGLILTNVSRDDGTSVDIALEHGRIGRISASGSAEATRGAAPDASACRCERLDLSGYVLLPAPAEPHAHLDKALLGARAVNRTEDLDGAIEAIIAAYASMDEADTLARASEAVRQAVAHGTTAIRTHVDCRAGIGSRSVRVLAGLRERLAGLVDLQIVALAGPVAGAEGREHRALLAESLEAGADAVGGIPTLEGDSAASVAELIAVASEYGVGMDLHVDETLDADAQVLRLLADRIIGTGFAHPVAASHCVSLSVQPVERIRETAARVAEAGIGIVALPQTNLYLQGREAGHAAPRGITAVRLLREAGVTVAGGGDNWRDPFNPMGRIDAFETASLLVAAGHQRVAEAYRSVSVDARTVMGLEPVAVETGAPAELVAIRGASLSDAIGRGSEERIVISRGRVIARTEVRTELGRDWPR